jgi:hypothetical protein
MLKAWYLEDQSENATSTLELACATTRALNGRTMWRVRGTVGQQAERIRIDYGESRQVAPDHRSGALWQAQKRTGIVVRNYPPADR